MVSIEFEFIAGRYHATPWGSHVNEGDVEWPPSPWRILRALISTGFNKLAWSEVPVVGRSLIEKLARHYPQYELPAGKVAHTRHYMPIPKGKKDETTSLVIDAFLRFDLGSPPILEVDFGTVELSPEELDLLNLLAESLSYLGRAESWVSARVTARVQKRAQTARPTEGASEGLAQRKLLALDSSADFDEWRSHAIGREHNLLHAQKEREDKKPSKRDYAKIDKGYPCSLVDCLLVDNRFLHSQGWNRPPGSRWVQYSVSDSTDDPKSQGLRLPNPEVLPEALLLELSSIAYIDNILPSRCLALPLAEALRSGAIKQLAREDQDQTIDCSELIGRDQENHPLKNHQHAHYVPLSLSQPTSGKISHFLVYSPSGLSSKAEQALRRVSSIWIYQDDQRYRVSVSGTGSLPDVMRQLEHQVTDRQGIRPLGRSTTWTSLTPFVPARHLKKNRGPLLQQLLGQIERELEGQGAPRIIGIELMEKSELAKLRFSGFVRKRRRGKQQAPGSQGFGLRITFSEIYSGPLILGYARHFGLGLFQAEETEDLSQ